MVFRDGAGNASIPGFHGSAFGTVHAWDASPVSPVSGDRPPILQPVLRALIYSQAGGPSSVEWQVSTVSTFASTVWTGSDATVPNGYANKTVTTSLTNKTQYYWRVRAGDGAGTWGLWSAAVPFMPDLSAGRGYLELYENVGGAGVPADKAFLELTLNQGVIAAVKTLAIDYIFENVGPNFGATPGAFDYLYLGDVSTNTPTPHLWFIRPTSGRAGDGISIVGHGLGSLLTTYSAVVEYDAGGGNWTAVPVVTWQTYPGTPAALTAGRTINTELSVIDPEHTSVEIVVPAGAIPPGYPIRIRTEAP